MLTFCLLAALEHNLGNWASYSSCVAATDFSCHETGRREEVAACLHVTSQSPTSANSILFFQVWVQPPWGLSLSLGHKNEYLSCKSWVSTPDSPSKFLKFKTPTISFVLSTTRLIPVSCSSCLRDPLGLLIYFPVSYFTTLCWFIGWPFFRLNSPYSITRMFLCLYQRLVETLVIV